MKKDLADSKSVLKLSKKVISDVLSDIPKKHKS